MNCPKCNIELKNRKIKGVAVKECQNCKGILLEENKLRYIKDRTDADLNWMDFDIWKHPELFKAKETKFNCPGCSESMDVLDYANTKIEIDYCSKCRVVWLEKNELKKIIAALEEELLTKSTEDYVKATLEEAKELFTGSESFPSEWKDFTTILRFLQYRILSLHPKINDTLVSFQENPLNR